MTDLAALRKAAEEATPGPWEFGCGLDDWHITQAVEDGFTIATTPFGPDGTYIALANPATVLALLDRLSRAEALLDRAIYFGSWEVEMLDLWRRDLDAYHADQETP